MLRQTHCACTSILVGKAASVDGSTLIARTEDHAIACVPKRFCVVDAQNYTAHTFTSQGNGFSLELNGKAMRYTASPDSVVVKGLFEEAGINSAGVAMSATESTYANDRVLAYDPLVENGLAEDALVSVVLPFISSAREGVKKVGEIVAEYGSAEGNSILFSDESEVWYMELATGHHWVAQRIPDDAYAVCSNRISIQEVIFDSDDFMMSKDIVQFVKDHDLNPQPATFDFRRIFGTYSQQDIHYNAPRVWFGQRYFNPEIIQEPEDLNLPFIRKANRLISVDDVAFLLSSHYNTTPYDPLGTDGTEQTRTRYRAISLSRTQEGHILQLRPNLSPEKRGIHWISFATTAFSPFVPFFANASHAHPSWERISERPEANSAYWLWRTLSMLSETRFAANAKGINDYLGACRRKAHAFVSNTDAQCAKLSGEALTQAYTEANQAFMDTIESDTKTLTQDFLMAAAEDSRLSFTMDENL